MATWSLPGHGRGGALKRVQVQQIILTVFQLWCCPKKNEQFLLELDEHNFQLRLWPLHYLYTYLHTLSAHTENRKGQGRQPFNELLQTWLKLQQEADCLGPWCLQRMGLPRQSARSNTQAEVGKAALSLLHEPRALPGKTRTRREFGLETAALGGECHRQERHLASCGAGSFSLPVQLED